MGRTVPGWRSMTGITVRLGKTVNGMTRAASVPFFKDPAVLASRVASKTCKSDSCQSSRMTELGDS